MPDVLTLMRSMRWFGSLSVPSPVRRDHLQQSWLLPCDIECLRFGIPDQGKGCASPSSHERALVALGRQKVVLEEQEERLKKEKGRLEVAIERESLQLQQVCAARRQVDKVLKDMESLETEENQGYGVFMCMR